MTQRVVIEVIGGLADCTAKPKGVEVIIIDHDNEKECEGYEHQKYGAEEEIIDPDEIWERRLNDWCKNIAENYNENIDVNLYTQIVDARKELHLDILEIGKRWQCFSAGDTIKEEEVRFLLVGERR